MAMTLKQLQQQLSGLEPYQEQSADALSEKARGLYKTQYESDLKALRDATEQGVLDINRSALDKGMQRSSYNQAQQGLMRAKGLESQQQLSTQYESNVANALNQLIENEYAKKTDADKYRNQLLMALYEYGRKGSGKATVPPPEDNGDDDNDVTDYNASLNGLKSGDYRGSMNPNGYTYVKAKETPWYESPRVAMNGKKPTAQKSLNKVYSVMMR